MEAFYPHCRAPPKIWVYRNSIRGQLPFALEAFLHNGSPIATSKGRTGQRFLFLRTSKERQYLLARHGSWLYLDSKDQLNMYSFPLTVLDWKTNTGKRFLACYYLSNLEDTTSHEEALALVKWSCPLWQPNSTVTNCAMELVNAVQSNLPSVSCIWC